MTRKILIFPDNKLYRKAQPVAEVTDEIRAILDDMAETMVNARGAGLAAPQIGVELRLVVLKVEDAKTGQNQIVKLVNPEISKIDTDEVIMMEGCLSFPGVMTPVLRAKSCEVRALDENGQKVDVGGEGFVALQLQHELDHLDGKILFDHIKSPMMRDKARSMLTNMKRRGFKYPERPRP